MPRRGEDRTPRHVGRRRAVAPLPRSAPAPRGRARVDCGTATLAAAASLRWRKHQVDGAAEVVEVVVVVVDGVVDLVALAVVGRRRRSHRDLGRRNAEVVGVTRSQGDGAAGEVAAAGRGTRRRHRHGILGGGVVGGQCRGVVAARLPTRASARPTAWRARIPLSRSHRGRGAARRRRTASRRIEVASHTSPTSRRPTRLTASR